MSSTGGANRPVARTQKLARRIGELQRMINEGRSFSGDERNCCFLNTAGVRFATVSAVTGVDFPDDGRALAVVDWDQDGDLDLWVSNRNAPRLRFLRNNHPRGNHFVAFRLKGNGATTNRDAIGARIEVVTEGSGGKRLIRSVRAGEGFLSQSSKWAHFGLGSADRIDKVTVRWPGGDVQEHHEIEVDRRYLVVQGSPMVRPLAAREKLSLTPEPQQVATVVGGARIPLMTQLPMPKSEAYLDFTGARRTLTWSGKPTLLLFWASWCAPCHAELRDIVERQEEIRAAGIDVAALAVDGLGEDGSDPKSAHKLIEHLKFPFVAGRARAELVQLMTQYHHRLLPLKTPLPIPTSFLIDGRGRLSVIYKGRVAVDQVLRDSGRSRELKVRMAAAACLPGRIIDRAGTWSSLGLDDARASLEAGKLLAGANRPGEAVEHFEDALRLRAGYVEAHVQAARALERLGDLDRAEGHYRAALTKMPKRVALHYNLGRVLFLLRKPRQAESCYRLALELDERHWMAHVNLALVLRLTNRQREAADHYRRALEINPSSNEARLGLDELRR